MKMYAKKCKDGIKTLMEEVGMDVGTAYFAILTVSTLMDLHPEDEEVIHIILRDCGVEVS